MSSPHSILSRALCFNIITAFRLENSSGKGFDLLWAGPKATNVPKEAIIVDSPSPDVVFSNPSMWESFNDTVLYYNGSLSFTNQLGASVSFSFDGVAIWYDFLSYTQNVQANLFLRYYGILGPNTGFCTVSIDGSEPERLSGKSDGGQLNQRMLWSKTNLTPSRHTFTLKQDGAGGTYTNLDFFRLVTSEVTE